MIPSHIKALILDMDGVIWKADAPIGDLASTFRRIRERGLKFVFATNNGTKTPEEYQEKLRGLGVEVESSQVVTSALGVAFMLARKYPHGTKVFVIGENGIRMGLGLEYGLLFSNAKLRAASMAGVPGVAMSGGSDLLPELPLTRTVGRERCSELFRLAAGDAPVRSAGSPGHGGRCGCALRRCVGRLLCAVAAIRRYSRSRRSVERSAAPCLP